MKNLKVNLALSLHSAIEETRNKIMPFSKKFSLDEIKDSSNILVLQRLKGRLLLSI